MICCLIWSYLPLYCSSHSEYKRQDTAYGDWSGIVDSFLVFALFDTIVPDLMIGGMFVHTANFARIEGDFDGGAEFCLLHELLHIVMTFNRDEGLSFHV